ncbi:MAG: hypothetical protein K9L56_13280 [Clostridiales bacterium]|nr:hypothetical protein [Clostridiales bacterium]
MRHLPIKVDKIPYRFEVKLSDKLYEMKVKYNNQSGDLTMDLIHDGNDIIIGKKILLGQPIFWALGHDNVGNKNPDFFDEKIIPYDLTWEEEKVTLDNLRTGKVKLYIID